MKKIAFSAILLLSTIFSGCNKSDDSLNKNPSGVSVNNTIINGTWYVGYFYDSNKDHTSKLSAYTFTFNPSGLCTSKNNGNVINGTWSTGVDDGLNRLFLSFPDNALPENISNDWVIESGGEMEIKLTDDNATSQEILIFKKY